MSISVSWGTFFFKVKKQNKTSESTQTSLKNFIQKGDFFSPLEQFIIEFS